MKIFSKKESLVQNITFLAIMAAINIVLLLLATVLPYLLILLTLILPFVSLLVTLYCKKVYYPIYLIVTIGLSFLVSFDAIFNVFFYIIPGIISGFIFGFCLEKEIPSSYSILYSAFVYVVGSYLTIILVNVLFEESVEDFYFSVLNLQNFAYRNYLISPFIFAIGIIQSSLSFFVIQNEIKKLGFEEKNVDDNFEVIYLFVFILLSLVAILVKPDIYLMFIGFAIYEFIHVLMSLFRKNTKLFIMSSCIASLTAIFAFAILFSLVPHEFIMVSILIPLFIVGIIVLINNCFTKENK
ncbi:MAG: hypothetical protein MJZ37_04845 [Bacilli bacterium]|nr:hypothetical protein [Bacilli bacterium]